VRWVTLFRDLEAQLEAAERAELEGEVADRSRREVARIRMADRLRLAVGVAVAVGVTGAGVVRARVSAVGADWVLLTDPGQPDAIVPLTAVAWLTGLPALAADPAAKPGVAARLDLAHAMRAVARDRAAVAVTLSDGATVTGTIDRVGADFLDLAEHPPGEPRRPGSVAASRLVAFGAIAVVRAG